MLWNWAVTLPAASRHTNPLLPLLPSGPGGVYSVSLREDRHGYHNYYQPVRLRRRIIPETLGYFKI
ncbi:MAG: hypothetical protein Kow0065_12250 [Methylomicrobium sp.]